MIDDETARTNHIYRILPLDLSENHNHDAMVKVASNWPFKHIVEQVLSST